MRRRMSAFTLQLGPTVVQPLDFVLRGGELRETLLQRGRIGGDLRILRRILRGSQSRLSGHECFLEALEFTLLEVTEARFAWSTLTRRHLVVFLADGRLAPAALPLRVVGEVF